MANVAISALPAAGSIGPTDLLVIVQGGATKKATGSLLDSLTQTFTNKTFDTAGTGNAFSINGLAATANTGTGAVARATSPTFVTPVLGTPQSGNLSNCTGYPTTGLGLTASPLSQFAATTSAQLAGVMSDETGTGALVFATSPALTTPNIGVAAGTSLTLSSLTANRATFAGTSGLLSDYAAFTYNSAYTYPTVGNYVGAGQPTLYNTNAGSAWVFTTLGHSQVGVGSFPLCFIEDQILPLSDQTFPGGGTADGGSTFKVRAHVMPTNTHKCVGAGGLDIYSSIDDLQSGQIYQVSGGSIWGKNFSSCTINYVFGAQVYAQNSGGHSSTSTVSVLNPLMVSCDGDSGTGDVTAGTIATMRAIQILGMGCTNATVTEREAIYIAAMPSTATTDYVINSQATQASLLLGPLGVGIAPVTRLHVEQDGGTFGSITPSGSLASDVVALSKSALTARPSANFVYYQSLALTEIANTGTISNWFPSAFSGSVVVKAADNAVYNGTITGGSGGATYYGTGSQASIIGLFGSAGVGGTGAVGTLVVGGDFGIVNVTGASSGTTATATGVRIRRPIGISGRTTTLAIGLDIERQDSATAPGATVYALIQRGTTDAILWSSKFSTYANVVTAGWGVPAVYAAGRVTAQSAANASISTYTVGAADGSFEVSANMEVSASTVLSTTLTCTYTDESNTARTMILPVQQLTGSFIAGGVISGTGAWETPVMHIRCKAATAITILTSTGTFTGVTYTAEGIIKQTA